MFSFTAPLYGPDGGHPPAAGASGMVVAPTGLGYAIIAKTGRSVTYGSWSVGSALGQGPDELLPMAEAGGTGQHMGPMRAMSSAIARVVSSSSSASAANLGHAATLSATSRTVLR